MIMYTKKSLKQKINIEHGYTLLFAVLTATLVLGVAIFILGVSRKQFALSVAARDSMYSLYAADSGMECAAATDIATSTGTTPSITHLPLIIQCNGQTFSSDPTTFQALTDNSVVASYGFDPSLSVPVFQVKDLVITLPGNTCALVTVTDGYYLDDADDEQNRRIIDSRGYNYCDSNGPKIGSTRTVERALRLTYE